MPQVKVIAIMDDVYMVGLPADALKAYELFSELCRLDGSLSLNHKKGKFIYFNNLKLPQVIWNKG